MTAPQIPKSPGIDLSRMQPMDCPLVASRPIDIKAIHRGAMRIQHDQIHADFLKEVEARRVNKTAQQILRKDP